jgi:hypothetical protein
VKAAARLLPLLVLAATAIGSIATEAPPVWYLESSADGPTALLTTTAATLSKHVTVVFQSHRRGGTFDVRWFACGDGAAVPMRAVLLRDQPDAGTAIERTATDCQTAGSDEGALALPVFDLCTAADCVQGYTMVFERMAETTSAAPVEIGLWTAHAASGGDGYGPVNGAITVTIDP